MYKLLIDTYRLRMDDMAKREGICEVDSLYDAHGAHDPVPGFRRFLALAKAQKTKPGGGGGGSSGILPPWWDADKEQACEQVGLTTAAAAPGDSTGGGGGGGGFLRRKLDEAAVLAHYRDELVLMHLRILGEIIYGRRIPGLDGAETRKMMAHQEAGFGRSWTLSQLDEAGWLSPEMQNWASRMPRTRT